MSVVSKLQFTHASRSSHSWLSKQPQLMQSSKLQVASLSCAELGTAQPQLVVTFSHRTAVHIKKNILWKLSKTPYMTVLFPLNCFFFQIVNFPGFVEENLDNIQLWPAEARTTQSLLLLIQDSEILLSVIPKVLFQLKKRFLKYIGIHSTLQFEESLQNCNKFCREVFMTRNFF